MTTKPEIWKVTAEGQPPRYFANRVEADFYALEFTRHAIAPIELPTTPREFVDFLERHFGGEK